MSGHADIEADIGHGTRADMRTSPYIGMSAVASPDIGEGLGGLFGTPQEEEKAKAKRIKALAKASKVPRRKRRRGTAAHVEAPPRPRRRKRPLSAREMLERRKQAGRDRCIVKPYVHRYDVPGHIEMWRRMKPGCWYTGADLVALMPESPRPSVRAWLAQRLVQPGHVVRTPNPVPRREGYIWAPAPRPKWPGLRPVNCVAILPGYGPWLYKRVEGAFPSPVEGEEQDPEEGTRGDDWPRG